MVWNLWDFNRKEVSIFQILGHRLTQSTTWGQIQRVSLGAMAPAHPLGLSRKLTYPIKSGAMETGEKIFSIC